jgi:hypothetical protein
MPAAWGTSEHWRERAEEARSIAEQIGSLELRRTMLEIAESYEDLAEQAAASAALLSPSKKG